MQSMSLLSLSSTVETTRRPTEINQCSFTEIYGDMMIFRSKDLVLIPLPNECSIIVAIVFVYL